MIRRIRKNYPALQPIHTLFCASLLYSLLICTIAVILPLHESLDLWTLALCILTAAVALPHVLPKITKPHTIKHPHRSYDRVLLAVLLGSLGFIAYALYFITRSVSGVGVDVTSQEHASATTVGYLTIFLGCAVGFYQVKKQLTRTLRTALFGLLVFVALAFTTFGQSLGFGKLILIDLFVIFGITVVFTGITYLVYHGRHHTRRKLLADHSVETLAHHVSKR